MSSGNTAIIYASYHHGNTGKLVMALAKEYPVDVIDIMENSTVDISCYERIGIASGVAFGEYYKQIIDYLKEKMPRDKQVFFIHTAGSPSEKQCIAAKTITDSKNCVCLGVFFCKGYDTYGPFKYIGGLNRKHPDADDITAVKKFYEGLENRGLRQ